MGDMKDECVKTVNMECNESNKRKLLDENEVVPSKRRQVENLQEPEPIRISYLPDQLLLDIFRYLTPIQLKAIAFTCVRMHRLIRDYTLWSEVDMTDTKVGTKRLRWFLENGFHKNTTSIKLRGFAKELKGCLGIVDTTKSYTHNVDDSIIYTNLVTINETSDSSDDEEVSCDDDEDDGRTETKVGDDEVRDPAKMNDRDQPKVTRMFTNEYVDKGPRVPFVKLADQGLVKKTDPYLPTIPTRCSCTQLACPYMSDWWPWPSAVLDRMEDLATRSYPFEETTTCSKPRFTLSQTLLTQLNMRCPNITELDLGYCNIDCKTTTLANFPPNLVKLSLCGTRMYNVPIPKTMLYHVHEHLPRLQHLNVSKCEWLTPDTWLSMSKLPHLRTLIATDCPSMKDFIAYASLATKYGFPVLEYVDFRGCPLSDSEVSALGWVPTLRELYLSPPLDSYDENFNLHTHFKNDRLPKVIELEDWEKEDYMNPNRDRRAGKKPKKRRGEGGGKLPLKKRKVDGDNAPRSFRSSPTSGGDAKDDSLTFKTILHPTAGSSKAVAATSKAYPDPQPGSSKNGVAVSTSKVNSDPQPGSSKDGVATSTSKDNYDPRPGSSKDGVAASTSKVNSEDDVEPSSSGVNNRNGQFFDVDEDSIDEVFFANGNVRGLPPNAPFRPNNPDDHRYDGPAGRFLGIKQILICQGGSIYQYNYDRGSPNAANEDIGIINHLPAGYMMVPDPVPNPVQPGASNIRRVRMVANLGNHLQLIDRQFNRQLDLFRCTSLVTDVSVRYFGRSGGDEFVHIGPPRNVALPNMPREATRNDQSSLRILVVSGYQGITDVSLKHLCTAAPFLTFLDVRNTMVTEEGVNLFMVLRPEVKVLFGHFDDRGHELSGLLKT